MLAWLIVISVFCTILVIAYYHVIKELNDYCTKTDRLLDFDPYEDCYNAFRYQRRSKNPYDSTPVFAKSILEMCEHISKLEERPVRYSQYHRDTGIDKRSFELLEERVDNIADTTNAFEDRIKDVENSISRLKDHLDTMEDEVVNNAAE